jgi:hypothetical protein
MEYRTYGNRSPLTNVRLPVFFYLAGYEMGRVEAFSVAGLDLWFNSHDHAPPHFHARRPGIWEIRIYFLTCTEHLADFEIKWGNRPSSKELKQLVTAGVGCREALLEEWEAKVCQ